MSRPRRGTRGAGTERPGWGGETPAPVPGNPAGGPAGFLCAHCGLLVPEQAHGTSQRNHCPHCLWSLHVDIKPGDRASLCKGEMEPVALWVSNGEEVRIVHRCTKCGVLKPNRIAGDDDAEILKSIAERVTQALSDLTDNR